MKFELFKGKNEEFYFRLKSGDAVVLRSEGYTTKSACQNGINSVKKNCTEAARYESKEAANGKLMFNLKATNGQVIATSGMMDDQAALDNTISALQQGAPGAEVVEE